jgi:hypothetical protein
MPELAPVIITTLSVMACGMESSPVFQDNVCWNDRCGWKAIQDCDSLGLPQTCKHGQMREGSRQIEVQMILS